MSFDVWPKYMVLPEGQHFRYGSWSGCAWGWLCAAFDEDDKIFAIPKSSPSPTSPAGQFAREIARQLRADMEAYDATSRNPDRGVSFALSDAFERCGLSEDEVAGRWRRAARRKGYVVDAGVF